MEQKNHSTKERVQKLGRFLSAMVMPNIGAFIAWGIITALFIPTGWIPNEHLAELVGPMVTYLLPLLIGYTGGKMVGDVRGGVVGAAATMGVIVGSDVPMFIGAMIMGPLGGYVIKKFDQAVEGRIPAGFEMLVNNFSVGIIGSIITLLAYLAIGPVVQNLTQILEAGVQTIVNAGLLPITSLVVEPAKILFLNNAINHGVFGPLGLQEAKEIGKSIFFLIESNPGPGLGILLAYWVFSKGSAKQSAPGAVIIHFLGGIHEIYFPYVLMNPMLLLAVIAGGATGVFVFSMLGAGLVATPSPGSIFALVAMAPKGTYLPLFAGVLASAAVSFLVGAYFIKRAGEKQGEDEFAQAQDKMAELKGNAPSTAVNSVIFACDAGMGSSAMAATNLRKRLQKEGVDIPVTNRAINELPSDAELVITHESLTERAKSKVKDAEHISIKNYFSDPALDRLVERLKAQGSGTAKVEAMEEVVQETAPQEKSEVLQKANIKLNLPSIEKTEAIKMAGQLLVDQGYVEEGYIQSMLAREEQLSTYMGNGIAIPHGEGSGKHLIKKSGVVVLQFPEGVTFGEEKAYLLIGIAGAGDEHLSILSNIAGTLESEENVELFKTTKDVDTIYNKFTEGNL